MARKRKGIPIDGWLAIDKPLGIGSTQVVSMVRRLTGAAKVGHGGTLDPLASGLLTGKYQKGIPADSRGALKGYEWLRNALTDKQRLAIVDKLGQLAKELDCSLAQFAIAWCAKNPNVSTVITGASRVEQVHENMKALEVLPKLTDDVMKRVDEILGKTEEAED